jgi:glycerophosphoryl diester phosphodiesterase
LYDQLEYVKRANAGIKTGYILSRVYGEIFGYEAADFYSIKSDSITEQLVKGAHGKGKEIHAWTVNKAYEIKRMRELGVDNIITDSPAYVREMLR